MRYLAPHPLPVSVKAPAEAWDPGEAALDHDDLERREALEDAFQHHAGDLALHGVDQAVMVLDIEGRPAAGGWRMPGLATDMHADRQAVYHRRLEDRPVARPAQRLGTP